MTVCCLECRIGALANQIPPELRVPIREAQVQHPLPVVVLPRQKKRCALISGTDRLIITVKWMKIVSLVQGEAERCGEAALMTARLQCERDWWRWSGSLVTETAVW